MTPELFMTQYMTPIYITSNNMVTPITTIPFTHIYEYVVDFCIFTYQFIAIFAETFIFLLKEAISAINKNLTFTEKILLCFCLYNLIASFVNDIDKTYQNKNFQDKLEKMEKYVKIVNKTITIRDNYECSLLEELKPICNQNTKRIQHIENYLSSYKENLDEHRSIINEHQTNEQKIFQKISQLNKELIKMKKELEKYD
jgi:hypothetical protein